MLDNNIVVLTFERSKRSCMRAINVLVRSLVIIATP
jgi:hypothetical protein